ncbi:hypothetical protein VNI00_002452 [Paramarasmius palmivorus]|uniref:UspA domain-containing protein n=1 Tax=Paramarasmius palmivorus TaxID=297713 RepID=A0AAW0DY21_9AGAR
MSTHELPVIPSKRLNWLKRPSSSAGRPSSSSGVPSLPVPTEGQQLNDYTQGAPLSRAATADSPSSTSKRWSASLTNGSPKTTSQNLPDGGDLQRTSSAQPLHMSKTSSGSFSRMSLSSMMGGFTGLSLSRTSTNTSVDEKDKDKDKERGRSMSILRGRRSSSQAASSQTEPPSRSQSRARSQSPFSFRRFRRDRESSPQPSAIPLANSDVDLSDSHSSIRPRNAFTDTDRDSDDETVNGETTTDGETDDEDWSGDDELDFFDPVTERNTEANAFTDPTATGEHEPELDVDPDPLGEGVNVVVPPEPYFPSTLNSGSMARSRKVSQPRRRKSTKHGSHHEPLEFKTSRPVFQRDRCTITVTQGDPDAKLGPGRKRKRYVVGSDLSEESRYAVEWGIGTVLRDGDEMLIVTVVENESRVDPAVPNPSDRTNKLRSQQERQGLAYILVRQATSLLQRTKLNVTIACQAWHAKNARHMLLDVVDHNEPVMLIVGSRGLGQLKGLKRPPRRAAHLAPHRAHVSLAEAGIDRVAVKVDEDVRVMRESVKRDDDRRDGGSGSRNIAVAEGGPSGEMGELGEDREEREKDDDDEGSASGSDDEGENVREGIKVAGN